VVSAPQVDEAMTMIETVCQSHQARLVVIDRDWQWELDQASLDGQEFTTRGHTYRLPLIGEHQVVNAITAMAAVEGLVERSGLAVPPGAYRAGIAGVSWPGRLEILNREPYVVVDSAMNGDSAEKLVRALDQYFPDHKPVIIFGASNDHPMRDMLEVLLPVADQVIMAASRHPRAESAGNLAGIARTKGFEVGQMPDVPAALEQALLEAGHRGLVCATGSLFLVADIREAWLRRQGDPLPPIDPIVLS
jgi:dihydrofolate synthase/folylpolyglutamate synthase